MKFSFCLLFFILKFIAFYLGFPLPEKKFSKLHFFWQKLSATSWLPLGGKLSAERTDEGQLHFRKLENFDIKFQSKMCCAPCFSEISPEIFRKPKMCYAPHSLRFRSAPSPQGEGFSIALFQGFPFVASPLGRLSTKLTEEVLSSIGKTSLTLDFATFPERGKQELLPLSEASPRGEALPRSGGDEGQLHFRKLETIRKQATPLVFQKFLPKYSENQKCAAPLIRFAFARHLPPKGKAFLGQLYLSPYLFPLRSACRAAISFSYPRPFGV